jgi:hypothetical protein
VKKLEHNKNPKPDPKGWVGRRNLRANPHTRNSKWLNPLTSHPICLRGLSIACGVRILKFPKAAYPLGQHTKQITSFTPSHPLAKAPRDVILGARIFGMGKNVSCMPKFKKLSHQKKTGPIRDTCCLLHVVCDNNNGVAFF